MENLIAHRLKMFRTSLNLTQAEFGDKCGISQRTYANLESGKTKKISAEYLNQIESAFQELSPKWLRQGVGGMLRAVPPPMPAHLEEGQLTAQQPMMVVNRTLAEMTDAEQTAYWKARAEMAEAELAAIEEAKRHEGAVRLISSPGGRSFNCASAEAAGEDAPVEMTVSRNHEMAEQAPEEEPTRRYIGYAGNYIR